MLKAHEKLDRRVVNGRRLFLYIFIHLLLLLFF